MKFDLSIFTGFNRYADREAVRNRIEMFLGPAILESEYSLLRSGIIEKDYTPSLLVKKDGSKYGRFRVELGNYTIRTRDDWVIFIYAYNRSVEVLLPMYDYLVKLGLRDIFKISISAINVLICCFNYKKGVLFVLFERKRKRDEEEVDSIVKEIFSDFLGDKFRIRKVILTKRDLENLALYFGNSKEWKLEREKSSRNIRNIWEEAKSVYEEYLRIVKTLEKFVMGFRPTTKKFRDIRVVLDFNHRTYKVRVYTDKLLSSFTSIPLVLEIILNNLTFEKVVEFASDKRILRKYGILKDYVERRGIIAALIYEEFIKNRRARDISYEFKGYDVESNGLMIEVKSFEFEPQEEIRLTENEKNILKDYRSKYFIYIVQNALSDKPVLNIIKNIDAKKIVHKKEKKSYNRIIIKEEEKEENVYYLYWKKQSPLREEFEIRNYIDLLFNKKVKFKE